MTKDSHQTDHDRKPGRGYQDVVDRGAACFAGRRDTRCCAHRPERRFGVDPNSADAIASEPRPDDQLDQFPFNPAGIIFDPADPGYDPGALPRFTLSKPPYPGPRRVRLLTGAGDRIPLRESEVVWDEVDTPQLHVGAGAGT